MLSLVPYLVSIALWRIEARAQAVCQPGYDWAFNSLGQSPCVLGGSVVTPCSGTTLVLGALTDGTLYPAMNTGLVNPCSCNTVKYTLTAVCALCQGRTPGQDSGNTGMSTYTTYTTNCANTFQGYPRDIPDGLAIPAYAFVPLGSNGRINLDAIRAAAGGPDSTHIPLSTSTGSTSNQTNTPTLTPTSNSPLKTGGADNTQTKSNLGPIIGGVIAALIGGVVITASAFLLWRRRTRNQTRTNARPSLLADDSEIQYMMVEADTPAYSTPHTPNPFLGPSEATSPSMEMQRGSFTMMARQLVTGSSSHVDVRSDVMSQRPATATTSQRGSRPDAGFSPRDSKREPPAYSEDPEGTLVSLHYTP